MAAVEVSVEKPITGLSAALATFAASRRSGAKTGPMMSSAPSATALWAASRAPSGVEWSSLTRMVRSVVPASA